MLQDYQLLQSLLYICGTMVCVMMTTEQMIGWLALPYQVCEDLLRDSITWKPHGKQSTQTLGRNNTAINIIS